MRPIMVVLASLYALASCGDCGEPPDTDAGDGDSGQVVADAGHDATALDARRTDAARADARRDDLARSDARQGDLARHDSAATDTAVADAAVADAAVADAAVADAAVADAAVADAAVADATPPLACQDMVAEWRFEENRGRSTVDVIHEHYGSFTGGVRWTTGTVGHGLAFDGTGKVEFADAPAFDPRLGDFTVETWLRVQPGQNGQRRMIAHGTHGQGGWNGFALMQWCAGWGGMPCGSVGLLLGYDHLGEWLITTCQPLDDGQWHHLVATLQRSGSMALYLDGTRIAAPCGAVDQGASWGPGGAFDISHVADLDIDSRCDLCLGSSCQYLGTCGLDSEWFSGDLDGVALYRRAIDASEVAQHYADGAGRLLCDRPCGHCGEPTCNDNQDNGTETDIDCGGDLCAACSTTFGCSGPDDCLDGLCLGNRCATSGCLDLAAGWRFPEASGSATHEVSGLHDGLLEGTAALAGGVVSFNGSGLVRVADSPALDPGTGDFAVEAWVNLPGSGHQRIVAHGTHGGQVPGFALMEWCAWGGLPCGSLALLLGVEGGGEYLAGTCAGMGDGQWHHVVANVDRSGFIELYVDAVRRDLCYAVSGGAAWANGEPGNISHLASTTIDSPCDLCIGSSCQNMSDCGSTSESLSGSVEGVAIYHRTLSPAEIYVHFDAGDSRLVCRQ